MIITRLCPLVPLLAVLGCGAAADSALVRVTDEAAGTSCASGGIRVDTGVDADGNGTLDDAEVSGTTYVCNGADGEVGTQTLVTVTEEPPGKNCPDGGQRVDFGADLDHDGTLDAKEIEGSKYVCNGLDGDYCETDADCADRVDACDTTTNRCQDTLTLFSQGTQEWPDQACNPTNSFGGCNTNAQDHADAWATWVCQNNNWHHGVWTGNKKAGCGNGVADGEPSVSMYCQGDIPCSTQFESTCATGDQTIVELTCYR